MHISMTAEVARDGVLVVEATLVLHRCLSFPPAFSFVSSSASTSSATVSLDLTTLSPQTTHYFRVVANNGLAGDQYGAARTFTTTVDPCSKLVPLTQPSMSASATMPSRMKAKPYGTGRCTPVTPPTAASEVRMRVPQAA